MRILLDHNLDHYGKFKNSTYMTQQSRNHHYISKFYQKGFASSSDGLIWVYEKGQQPKLRPIREIGMIPNFYESQAIEDELGTIESNAAPVIRKLTLGKKLTSSEKAYLAKFISVLRVRTPKFKVDKADKIAKEMMPEFLAQHDEKWLYSELKNRVNDPLKLEQIFERERAKLLTIHKEYSQDIPSWLYPEIVIRRSLFELLLLQMDWVYFRTPDEIEFITCDNPVAYNQKTGLKDQQAVVMCPLTKNLFLQAMWVSNYSENFVTLPAAKVKLLNRYVAQNAHKQVYASHRSLGFKLLVENRVKQIDA